MLENFWSRILSHETVTKTRTTKEGEILRSSCLQMFFKIGVLKNFAIFTGEYLFWSLFLIKLQLAIRPATLLKTDSNTDVFLWILRNFTTPFFIKHFWWLLLGSTEIHIIPSVIEIDNQSVKFVHYFCWKEFSWTSFLLFRRNVL